MSVSFTDGSLRLDPGESRRVGVRVSPAGHYSVRLSLTGDASDAFLDASTVDSDDEGHAEFALTAPSSAATFGVRAAVQSAVANLAVSAGGAFTTLTVVPIYTGARKIDSWTATVATDGKCEGTDVPPPDGTLFAYSPLLRVEPVPLGTSLRVTVRAGHYVGGCKDVLGVLGFLDTVILVTATDRPLQLGGANLDVKLRLDSGDGWAAAWSTVVDQMMTRYTGGKSDAVALLDAMQGAAPASGASAFASARKSFSWDTRVAASFERLFGASALSTQAKRWLTAGVGADGGTTLVAALVAPTSENGKAKLAFSSIGGVSAQKASFPASIDVTWTSAASDRVLFGGTATFRPYTLAAALAEVAATNDVPGTKTVSAALGSRLSCDDVASTLVDSSKQGDQGVAYGDCGKDCLAALCQTALATMWTRVVDPSQAGASFELSANGKANQLSDSAMPTGFDGAWTGTATIAGRVARVSGEATGKSDPTSIP